MSKTAAAVAGVAAAYLVAFSVSYGSYTPVVNWLGPVFGESFRVTLAFMYAVLASPSAYPAVLAVWITAGVLVGVFSRGLKRSVEAALAVFGFTSLLLAASVSAVFAQPGLAGLPSGRLPPVPSGTNTLTLLGAPVFKELAPLFLKGPSQGAFSASATGVLLVAAYFENLAALILVSAAVGYAFSKARPRDRLASKMPSLKASRNQPTTIAVALTLVFVLAFTVAAAFPLAIAHSAGASGQSASTAYQAQADPSSFHSELVLGVVNPSGQVSDYYGFASSTLTLDPSGSQNLTANSPMLSGAIIAALYSGSQAQTLLSQAPQWIQQKVSEILPLLPPYVILLAYSGACSQSTSQAGDVVGSFTSTFGLTDVSELVQLYVSASQASSYGFNASSGVCVYVYQADPSFSQFASTLTGKVDPTVEASGLINVLDNGLSSGFLNPGSSPQSANSTAFFVGFAQSSVLSQIPFTGPVAQGAQGLVGFVGAAAQVQGAFIAGSKNASLAELTHYSSKLAFNPESNSSAAGVGTPLSTATSGQSQYGYTLVANGENAAKAFSSSLGSPSISVQVNPSGANPSQIAANLSTPLPPKLVFTAQAKPVGSGNAVVTVTLTASQTISGVVVNSSAFTSDYPSLKLVSGSTTASTPTLQAGRTLNLSFTVHMAGTGEYVVPPVQASYTYAGTGFSAQSTSATVQAPSQNALGALFSAMGDAVAYNTHVSAGAGYALALALFVLAVAAACLMEYKSLRAR
ncbi:MAG: hypothetical protein QW767_06645 [Thermoprotei archaeon]